MPIITKGERRLHEIIMTMDRSQFCQMLNEADDLAIEGFKKGVRKFLMLGMTIPDYLNLLSELEEKILDTIAKNNRLSIPSLYNSLDDSSSEALFILGFCADVQYYVAKEHPGPQSPTSFSSQNDFTPSR